jgi:hypothetical protein
VRRRTESRRASPLNFDQREEEKPMKPVIATGIFGIVAIVLAAETLNIAMAFGEFSHVAALSGGVF